MPETYKYEDPSLQIMQLFSQLGGTKTKTGGKTETATGTGTTVSGIPPEMLAGLQQVLQQQLGQITPEGMSALIGNIFREGSKQVPILATQFAQATGGRVSGNSPLAMASAQLQAELAAKATQALMGAQQNAAQTAFNLAQVAPKTTTVTENKTATTSGSTNTTAPKNQFMSLLPILAAQGGNLKKMLGKSGLLSSGGSDSGFGSVSGGSGVSGFVGNNPSAYIAPSAEAVADNFAPVEMLATNSGGADSLLSNMSFEPAITGAVDSGSAIGEALSSFDWSPLTGAVSAADSFDFSALEDFDLGAFFANGGSVNRALNARPRGYADGGLIEQPGMRSRGWDNYNDPFAAGNPALKAVYDQQQAAMLAQSALDPRNMAFGDYATAVQGAVQNGTYNAADWNYYDPSNRFYNTFGPGAQAPNPTVGGGTASFGAGGVRGYADGGRIQRDFNFGNYGQGTRALNLTASTPSPRTPVTTPAVNAPAQPSIPALNFDPAVGGELGGDGVTDASNTNGQVDADPNAAMLGLIAAITQGIVGVPGIAMAMNSLTGGRSMTGLAMSGLSAIGGPSTPPVGLTSSVTVGPLTQQQSLSTPDADVDVDSSPISQNNIDMGIDEGTGTSSSDSGDSGNGVGSSSVGTTYKHGGSIKGPGTGTSDSIPIRASAGEFMIPADVVDALGEDFFNTLTKLLHTPSGAA